MEHLRPIIIKDITSSQKLKGDFQVYSIENVHRDILPEQVAKALEEAGFSISMYKNVNDSFKEKFHETRFAFYTIITIYQEEILLDLFREHSQMGLFSPISMVVYRLKESDVVTISSLSHRGLSKIMKIDENDVTLQKLTDKIEATINLFVKDEFFRKNSFDTLFAEQSLVNSYQIPLHSNTLKNTLHDFELMFQQKLKERGFSIVDSNNFTDKLQKPMQEMYGCYKVFSICKLELLYEVTKTYPNAGIFAPCSFFVYQKRGDNRIYLGFPSVYNWMRVLSITNMSNIEYLLEVQEEMNLVVFEIMQSLSL